MEKEFLATISFLILARIRLTWLTPISTAMQYPACSDKVRMIGRRPPLESPVVVSSTSFRFIQSLTMVDTVALFRPVSSEMRALEISFLSRIWRMIVKLLAVRISLVWEIFMKTPPGSGIVLLVYHEKERLTIIIDMV